MKKENEEMTDTLNQVIGDVVIRASSGVQGEKNLRTELIKLFKGVKLPS